MHPTSITHRPQLAARLIALATVATIAATGCTGFTPGENRPGADTWLEGGSIAVDPRTENAFVLRRSESDGVERKELIAIDADANSVQTVLDLAGLVDVRILFPENSIMVMTEEGRRDTLWRLDPQTLAVLDSVQTMGRFHGTRMSSSRRWIAVADNVPASAPIHIIDSQTLQSYAIPHDGDWLEAMWLPGRDELYAIIFYDIDGPNPRARIMSWTMDQLATLGFPTDTTGYWPNPRTDVDLPGVSEDFSFSYTWVGVAPDDRHVVFPVRRGAAPELLVLDTQTAELRIVDDALGPVGFTPDGSTIVSYRYVTDANNNTVPYLLFIDADTLATELLELPVASAPQYFVTREGNFVVVASHLGGERLILFDLDQQQTTTLADPGINLWEFVSRLGHGELWLVDRGLYRLDLYAALLEQIPLGFVPEHINIQRARDRLIVDDDASSTFHFIDPDSQVVTRSVFVP